MEEKQCSNCALYILENSGCARTQTIEAPTNSCSHWCEYVPTCSLCGRRFVPPISWFLSGTNLLPLCPSCFNARNTCGTCKSSGYCDFQENPIAIPPMVQATRRQGNMTMTQTVPNPERIKATCMNGCPCWHEDGEDKYCCRQFNCCGNYDMRQISIERSDDLSDSTTESV